MKRLRSALVTVFTSGTILAFSSFGGAVAHAATNLVQNGGFETNGGQGQLDGTYYPQYPNQLVTTAAHWHPNLVSTTQIGNYNFITSHSFLASTNYYYPGIWGATPGYANGNGFHSSPNGGWFLASDGFDYRSPVEQTITGLDVGSTYTLSFEYARSQEANVSGNSYQKWVVNFGGESFETPNRLLVSHGFDGWYTATNTFTASSATQVLSFLAVGTNGVPPYLLLDGVSLTANDPTPPSPAATPGPLPLLGMASAFAWSGKLRRRIQAGAAHRIG
jgi:hypothetical protein